MKQIFALLVAILLITPVAIAQEETADLEVENPSTGEDVVDEETEEEIEAIKDHYGAKVRLLQLEKRIDRNIVRAQGVIDYIKENFDFLDLFDDLILSFRLGYAKPDKKSLSVPLSFHRNQNRFFILTTYLNMWLRPRNSVSAPINIQVRNSYARF